jgi:hypothetical protein
VRHRNQSGYFFKLGASGGDHDVQEGAAVPGTTAVAENAVAVGEL